MVDQHAVGHESPLPVGAVIRGAVDWPLFRIRVVSAAGRNGDPRREGKKVHPIYEGRTKNPSFGRCVLRNHVVRRAEAVGLAHRMYDSPLLS